MQTCSFAGVIPKVLTRFRSCAVWVTAGLSLANPVGVSAQAVNVAGNWSVSGRPAPANPGSFANSSCKLEQAGRRLSGTCIGPDATGPVDGEVVGRAVSWTWTYRATDFAGANGVTNFTGTYVDSNLIRGEMSAPGGSVWEFTHVRVTTPGRWAAPNQPARDCRPASSPRFNTLESC
jgi:hypothetical protein